MSRPARPRPAVSSSLQARSRQAPRSPIQMRMPCPDCGAGIDLALGALLTAHPIWCSACGLRLDIQPDSSAPALTQLQHSLATLESVRDVQTSPDTRLPGKKDS